MSKLPKVRIVRTPARQRQALARWLSEWRIDRLQGEDGQEPSGKSSGLLYDVEPAREGQIRLLHPISDKTAERPRYVVTLKSNSDGSWLVAPFSRFSNPAVPGEWKTGREAPALRILCIWNAGSLSGSVLTRSWVVDHMTATGITKALTIHRLLSKGNELPRSLSRRTGPPIVHPLDPRIEYLEEEREWFSVLSAKRPSGKHEDSPYAPLGTSDRALPLAAEERGKYRPTKGRSKKRRGDG